MVKDVEVAANDLKVYFRGLEVALGRGDIDDAIRYINNIKKELYDNLNYLKTKKSMQQSEESGSTAHQAA